MTTVTYGCTGNRYKVKCSGHTTGSEKACAGVSAIVYALAGYLLNTKDVITTEKSSLASGEAEIVFVGGTEAQTAYEMAVIGLMQLAQTFPEFVIVKKI